MEQHSFLVRFDCHGPVIAEEIRDAIAVAIKQHQATKGLTAPGNGGVEAMQVHCLAAESGAHLTVDDYSLLEKMCDWAMSVAPGSGSGVSNIQYLLDGDWDWEDKPVEGVVNSLTNLQSMSQHAQNPYDPLEIVREGSTGSDLALVGMSAWVKLHGGETIYICDSQQGLEIEYREAHQEATDTPTHSLVVGREQAS